MTDWLFIPITFNLGVTMWRGVNCLAPIRRVWVIPEMVRVNQGGKSCTGALVAPAATPEPDEEVRQVLRARALELGKESRIEPRTLEWSGASDRGRATLAYRIQRQRLTLVRPTALFTASRRFLDL